MAHHDFIDQLAAAIMAGNDGSWIISRALWSGLSIDLIDSLIEAANEVAAG